MKRINDWLGQCWLTGLHGSFYRCFNKMSDYIISCEKQGIEWASITQEGKKWDGRGRVYCQCLERLVLHLILLGLGVFPEWLLFNNTAPWDIAAILVFYWTSCCLY
jgi:hypothetical protein